jgi:serine/threonine protein phosphatase PrpC
VRFTIEDGTTACVAVFYEDKVVVANIGDSEMILGRKDGDVSVLTEVHNPKKNPNEGKRIEEVGGRLYHDRVGHPKLNPNFVNIAVSRAM